MAIPLPNLDDRTYADLAAEAQTLLPSLYPGWTNHNASDPGIVLVELLAWLTEMLMFQVNEIPATHTETFLKLLNEPDWTRPANMSLDDAVRQTMRDVRERYRAVTPDDYAHLALHDWPTSEAAATLIKDTKLESAAQLRRVQCVPRRDLETGDVVARSAPAPGHISLVVVPQPAPGTSGTVYPTPDKPLRDALLKFFDERRTLTTRLHIVGPSYVEISVAANLALHEDALLDGSDADARKQARAALVAFFDPLTGGPDGTGWPFGLDVFASEIYAALEQVDVVNYVEDVQLFTTAGPDRVQMQDGRLVGIGLDAHELVKLMPGTDPKQAGLVAYDTLGRAYAEGAA